MVAGDWGVLDLNGAVEAAQGVVDDVVGARADAVDRDAAWPDDGLRALLDAGLGGLVVPQQYGGHGLGLVGLTAVCETIGAACASTALCMGMHHVAAAAISTAPTDEQVERYLTPIVEGRHVTTLALSEPGTGVHFWLPRTRLRSLADGGYELDGEKSFVTNGGFADSYVVSAVAAEPEAPPGSFSCVLVERDTDGLTFKDPWRGLGMRGNSSRGLTLTAAPVPTWALLGKEGDQIRYVFDVIAPFFLAAMAGTYLGVARSALTDAAEHTAQRTHAHTGRTLATEPIVQHRLGQMWARVERSRQLVRFAAAEFDGGGPDAVPALCSAKANVAEDALWVVNEAMTLMGGIAYRDGSRLDRNLRDVRAAHVMSPTTELLRLWTGRHLLDLPLLAE